MSFLDVVAGGATSALTNAKSVLSGAENKVASLFGGSGGNGAPLTAQSANLDADFIAPNQRPEYQVTIIGNDADGWPHQIIGYAPESFSLDTDSSWTQPFADNLGGNTANIVGQLLGQRWTTQGLSSQFWTGSSPLSFNLNLTFVAESSPNDLLDPIRSLYALQLPTLTKGGFFKAPGPKLKVGQDISGALSSVGSSLVSGSLNTVKNAVSSAISGIESNVPDTQSGDSGSLSGFLAKFFQYENQISVQIGTFMIFSSVVITNISNEMKVQMTRDGVPLTATVSVGFQTHQTLSADDVQKIFNISPARVTPTGVLQQPAVLNSPMSAVAGAASNVLNTLVSKAQQLV